jgi:hypothetical protein
MKAEHTPILRYKTYPTSLKQADIFGPPHTDGSDFAPLFSVQDRYAEFIVRACNAHEKLVEACKNLSDELCGAVEILKGDSPVAWQSTLSKAQAALALAEKGTQ